MAAVLGSVPDQHLRAFHHMERALFRRFIFELHMHSSDAMIIIFFWLTLEQYTACSIITDITGLSGFALQLFVDEARICMAAVIHGPAKMPLFSDESIELTRVTTGKRLTLAFLHEMRGKILASIDKDMNTISSRIFGDIMTRFPRSIELVYGTTAAGFCPPAMQTAQRAAGFGSTMPRQTHPVAAPWMAPEYPLFSEKERTLYLTFSKGYPIPKDDVIAFFNGQFGGCVEAYSEGHRKDAEQNIDARMIVRRMAAVLWILGGNLSMKYFINGRHVIVKYSNPMKPYALFP